MDGSLLAQLIVHQVVPNFPLIDARIEPPELIANVLLVLGVCELEETAFSLAFDEVASQFVCHLLRGNDEALAKNIVFDVFQ